VWLQRRQAKQLAAMQLAVARGEIGKARPSLESLSAATSYSIAAAAHLSLARLAERDARWGDALEHCDRGIARLLRFSAAKATHGDYLLPELMATRAYVLAAADRRDEANAEMTVVTSEYPSYVWIAVAEFRTRLMAAVRAGDLSAAARVAMTRTADLPLSIRDDTLSDIVLAGATEVALDERERIDAELSDDPKLRAWIDAVGSDLRPQMRVRVSPAGKPVADVGELAEDDEVVQDAGNRPRRLVVS
jgi:hypothetical protein